MKIWCFIFIITLHVFTINFYISKNRVKYSPSNTVSTINNISMSVKGSNLIFEAAWHDNPGAEKNFAGLSSYISRQIFLKFSNTLAYNNVSLWTYKSWCSPNFFYFNSFCVSVTCISNIFHIFFRLFTKTVAMLYLIPQVSHFVSSRPYFHLILWILSERLMTRSDIEIAINLGLSINCNM